MNFIITLLILIIILGIIIFGHEFGHFIVAKKCGVYVDEFALGMGPVLWKHKPKNSETTYTLRAFPVGGFVSMAEESTLELKLKKNQILENKSTLQKLAVLLMGIVMNFVLAIVLFFISGLFFGKPVSNTEIGAIVDKSPAYTEGLEVGDKILEINGVKTYSWDDIILEIDEIDNTIFTNGKTAEYLNIAKQSSSFSDALTATINLLNKKLLYVE